MSRESGKCQSLGYGIRRMLDRRCQVRRYLAPMQNRKHDCFINLKEFVFKCRLHVHYILYNHYPSLGTEILYYVVNKGLVLSF